MCVSFKKEKNLHIFTEICCFRNQRKQRVSSRRLTTDCTRSTILICITLQLEKLKTRLVSLFFFFFGKSFELEICPGENLEREMVRKVNIMVPVYDDTCFNFCGKLLDTQRLECKKKWCQELGEHIKDYHIYVCMSKSGPVEFLSYHILIYS